MFLSIAETIVGHLLCCGLGIIQYPLNFLYYINIIGYCKFSTTPRNYHSYLAVLYPVLYWVCNEKCISPFSIASITASVSLLLIQSISCLWDLSFELSNLRRPAIPPLEMLTHDFGKACRPSNRSTRSKSTSLMVSKTHLSSPWRAFSIASGNPALNKSCNRIAQIYTINYFETFNIPYNIG